MGSTASEKVHSGSRFCNVVSMDLQKDALLQPILVVSMDLQKDALLQPILGIVVHTADKRFVVALGGEIIIGLIKQVSWQEHYRNLRHLVK